jgi:hypothetical protein
MYRYCMALKVYTCQEAASGPKTFLNIFCKLLQQNEPSPAWQWSWFQYQLTLVYSVFKLFEEFCANREVIAVIAATLNKKLVPVSCYLTGEYKF